METMTASEWQARHYSFLHDLVTNPDTPEIHISDITTFLACRRQWDWTSEHRRNLEPKRPYMPFLTGRAVHLCIERFLAYQETWEKVLPPFLEEELREIRWRPITEAERKEYEVGGADVIPEVVESELWAEIAPQVEEQMEMVRGIMTHYYDWEENRQGPFNYKNLEPITMEQAFRVPILHSSVTPDMWGHMDKWVAWDQAVYAGRWDGVVRRKDTGQVYVREDKTTRAIPSRVKLLANEYQPTGYSYAFRLMFPELAEKFSGVLYTLISKRVPKMPKVLMNGMLSQDTKDQSFESYMRFLEIHHGEQATQAFLSAHYGPTILSLYKSSNSNNVFFDRYVINRSEEAIHQFQGYLVNLGMNMLTPSLPVYPTPGYHCSYCFMNEPCIVYQNNGPGVAEMVLQDNYKLRPPRTTEVESED